MSIATLPILLTGCAKDHFRIVCPTLTTYSPEFQAAAANELPKAGEHVQTLVTDYGKHRDACRALSKP